MTRHRKFEWQAGYGAFGVSASQVNKTIAYINGQKEHHRKRTFKEEFIRLLDKHGISYSSLRVSLIFSCPLHGLYSLAWRVTQH